MIAWSDILKVVEAAAPLIAMLPPPANTIAAAALALARGFVDAGCEVDGCPYDLRAHLRPADIPAEDDAMFREAAAADARVRGLDRPSITAQRNADEEAAQRAKDRADYDELFDEPADASRR